jgi:hypothetical protein
MAALAGTRGDLDRVLCGDRERFIREHLSGLILIVALMGLLYT